MASVLNLRVCSLNPTLVEGEPTEGRDLLDRACGGDAEAFCDLCRVHETRLLRHAVALCGDPTLAEDLAQDTLVAAWKCLRRYHGGCQFFTWLCAILLNRYRNTLREKRSVSLTALARHSQEKGDAGAGAAIDPAAWPDQAAAQQDQADLVRRCVQALPRKHQQVIYLRFYVDDSLAGIAAAVGCSVGTVKSRLFHALEKLRGMRALSQHARETKEEVGVL